MEKLCFISTAMPYENRTIMSNLAKRPLKKLLVEANFVAAWVS